jgi:hypothetical protein
VSTVFSKGTADPQLHGTLLGWLRDHKQVNLGQCLLPKGTADPQLHGPLPGWLREHKQVNSGQCLSSNKEKTDPYMDGRPLGWLIHVSVSYTEK